MLSPKDQRENLEKSTSVKGKRQSPAASRVSMNERVSNVRSYRKRNEERDHESEKVKIGRSKNGRWSLMEHVRFLEALKLFGKNWKKVEEYVATRTSTQARSHAQKFFGNIEKTHESMEVFLENIS